MVVNEVTMSVDRTSSVEISVVVVDAVSVFVMIAVAVSVTWDSIVVTTLVEVVTVVTVVLDGMRIFVGVVTTVTLGFKVSVYDLVDVGTLFVDFVDCLVTQPV